MYAYSCNTDDLNMCCAFHRLRFAHTAPQLGMATVPGLPAPRVVHPARDDFPLPHSFLNAYDSDPKSCWIIVRMDDFFEFLNADPRLHLCPVFSCRSEPNRSLRPITDFITTFKDVPTQSGTRTYKYSEGLINVQLTTKGALLGSDIQLLTIKRQCHASCKAVSWLERITVENVKARTVQIFFTSFIPDHTTTCVRDGATTRCKPLIAEHVMLKCLCRMPNVRPRDLESCTMKVDLSTSSQRSGLTQEQLRFAKPVPYAMAQNATRNTKRIGRENTGDFDVIHRIVRAELQRCLETGQVIDTDTVAVMERNDCRIVDYHPVEDSTCTNVDDPSSWFWCLIQLPGADVDMESYAGSCGLAYDAKIKMIIEGLAVMPICTTKPQLPTMPTLGTPAYGCLLQHVTQPNYILITNTEAAPIITAMAEAIRGCLRCNRADCDHRYTVAMRDNGGFTLMRPDCVDHERPGLWSKELIDACAAYLKSIYS